MKKIFKLTSIGLILIFIAGAVFSLTLIIGALKSLPDVEKLVKSYAPSVPTTIYDSQGRVIDLISREMREEVDIENLPPYVKNSFVAIEDRRFYSHSGVDPIRLGKAFLVNLSKGRAAQGGSTITQQLAKNAFLTNEKKLMRKVKELLISIEIEKKYDKDEILEKYINEIYFGSGFYGIQTASQSIFGKRAEQLNLPEAAMLAGIPNRPSYYNPRQNLQAAVKRSHLVLRQMLSQELISQEEYDTALEHKFIPEEDFKGTPDRNTTLIMAPLEKTPYKSPEFIDIIKEELFTLFGEEAVYEDGLKVYTSLDLDMQKAAMDAFNGYAPFKRDSKMQGALVTIDSHSGYVKAMVGGRDFKSGNFNRALRAQRQPGSAFKPFVYLTAIEKGIPMNAVRKDEAIKYGEWELRNYGNNFIGDVTLLEAMERSINTISVRLLEEVGVNEVIKTVSRTGVEMDIPKNLTAALGTMDTTPYDLAAAYLPFSNGGYRVKPVFITKVLNRDDYTVYEHTVRREKSFDTEDMALIVHMMENVVSNGSGRNARIKFPDGTPVQQGGKTGTTNGFRSAWFAGFTPEYVTTVYMGYDDNSSMPYGSTGGSLAAPLWRSYYQMMINRGVYTPERFKFIDDEISHGDLVMVDFDSRTGLAGEPTEGDRRTGLFRRGQEPVEKVRRHFLKLGGFFSRGREEDIPALEEESHHAGSDAVSTAPAESDPQPVQDISDGPSDAASAPSDISDEGNLVSDSEIPSESPETVIPEHQADDLPGALEEPDAPASSEDLTAASAGEEILEQPEPTAESAAPEEKDTTSVN